jgi:hypothetical protein
MKRGNETFSVKEKDLLKYGEKVNTFTFLRTELVGKNKTLICACRCGAEKRFWKLSAIKRQETCGCGMDDVGLTAKQRRSMLSRMQGYKSGAKIRNFAWEITYEQFVKVATGNCFFCNAPPKVWDCVSNAPSVRKDCPNINPADYLIKFNGIDRLNSKLGYVMDNIVSCCVHCNRAKSDMTYNEFVDHVQRMHSWLYPKK